jgi:acyl-CoA synthetase (NDP forming)
MPRIMEVLDRDENVDNLVMLTGARWGMSETPKSDIETMAELRKKSSKPVMAVVSYSTPEEMQGAREATELFQKEGVPAFPSIQRGAKALKNAYDYYRHRESGIQA